MTDSKIYGLESLCNGVTRRVCIRTSVSIYVLLCVSALTHVYVCVIEQVHIVMCVCICFCLCACICIRACISMCVRIAPQMRIGERGRAARGSTAGPKWLPKRLPDCPNEVPPIMNTSRHLKISRVTHWHGSRWSQDGPNMAPRCRIMSECRRSPRSRCRLDSRVSLVSTDSIDSIDSTDSIDIIDVTAWLQKLSRTEDVIETSQEPCVNLDRF